MTTYQLHNETALFHQLAGGSEEAFEVIFSLYRDRLFRFAFKMIKSSEEADELVQETFVKLWESRDLLSSVNTPANYIFCIIRNKTIDRIRKISLDSRLREQVWKRIEDARCNTEEILFAEDTNQLIQEAFEKLSPQRKVVFKLSRFDGLNHEEIAGQLHISENTVKNHLVSSLRFIREHLDNHSKAMVALAIMSFLL